MRWDGLIWDVDGTLAYTEKEAHLPACNAAFAALGIPIQWSWEEFQGLLTIPGNHLRMAEALRSLPSPPKDLEELARRLADLKRKLYLETFLRRTRLRAGVRDWIREARRRGLRQAIVSTTDEEQISALLRLHFADEASWFAPVLGKRAGRKTAPDSPLYRRCLEEWGLPPERVLAIEDSAVGLQAARAAGLPCLVVFNDYTAGQDFRMADWVADSLARLSLDQLARKER
ncbi:Fructose-1-phosphate phosphatase YqaB [Methylacidimicrobium cyclopophantes]|uniref:Fructose-1-phosphate phosphatase YqaB n=1 Tax=Methylacidimicrobium cyclopophantes TaxID=1041766 RepID=A0A5E6MC89_9BACT|nr:HAD-IA family hydrolase [Methylacidimicrobium cyclopophantes]VVM05390.1 Fructose-1-phosphate phosphatase YqaB [Methylacidimicrobium cyclopophantes]